MMGFKIIKVLSVQEIVKQRKKLLDLEIDYLLLSLSEAIKKGNDEEKKVIKYELECIMEELEILQS